MSRYYSLTISNPKTGQSIVPDGHVGFTTGTGPTFSSLYKDALTRQTRVDPGALHIEFDIPVLQLAKPQGAFRVKIFGVGLKMIGQAANLSGMRFQLKAGMSAGLPLANPAQAGVIAEGNIFQAYGNWQGVDQTLDLLVNPGPPGTTDSIFDRKMYFFWPAESSLYDAIDAALQAALPEFKRQIFIDPRLLLPNDEAGWYATPTQWASYLLGITQPLGAQILGFNYPGVQVCVTGDTIYVFDGTDTSKGPGGPLVPLKFQDLIGQPTWLTGTDIGFSTVLRADIGVGNRVRFPQGIASPFAILSPKAGESATSATFPLPAKNKSIFQGDFIIQEVHHFGSFRQPDADSWATAFRATPPPPGSSS
ncbi:MAG TPA: hypothetical protein VGR92_06055 [Steroidobacteraceae bacterium]|nr:hypothetical protein [Steroidobacteraceae bacterium]